MAGGGTAAYHKAEDRIKIEKRIKELERRVSGLEHDPIKIHNMKLLVKMAHEKIEAALPEDEPDCVPDWVCELLIQFGYEFALGVAIAKQLNGRDEARS